MAGRIPDEALVVRGGRNQPEDIRRGTQTHPSGVTGASVECAEGMSLGEMLNPRVYADFQNADAEGRLRLNCVGTSEDLAQQQISLREGMTLTLYSDDLDDTGQLDELLADGVVRFSEEENCWVAAIDWSAIRHASDERNGAGH